MSYCRFLEGDVYAYDSVRGGVQFYASDGRRNLDRLCRTYNEAYLYALELRDVYGLEVPDHAIEALRADALEEAARICGPDSAVAELEEQNAKLRELVRVMAYCMQQVRDCDGCAANGADGAVTAPSGCDWLRDRMRELGVVE